MLHRFLHTIRHVNHTSGFEVFLMNLQRSGLSGAPRVEEARRDYQAIVKTGSSFVA